MGRTRIKYIPRANPPALSALQITFLTSNAEFVEHFFDLPRHTLNGAVKCFFIFLRRNTVSADFSYKLKSGIPHFRFRWNAFGPAKLLNIATHTLYFESILSWRQRW